LEKVTTVGERRIERGRPSEKLDPPCGRARGGSEGKGESKGGTGQPKMGDFKGKEGGFLRGKESSDHL